MSDSLRGDATGEPESEATLRRYPDDIRKNAIAAVERRRLLNPRDRTIYREVAVQFQVGEQSLRLWVKKHDADILARGAAKAGSMFGARTDNAAKTPEELQSEMESMRRKIEQLQAENEALKRAFVVFSAEWSK